MVTLLTFKIIQPPRLAAIAVSEMTGEFMYTPVSNENGSDEFTFQVSDGTATSEMANVEIWITPVKDVPVGQSYALTLNEDSTIQHHLDAQDVENDTLTFMIAEPPKKGNVILNNHTFTYVPQKDINGHDVFYYQVDDAQAVSSLIPVALTILPVNDPPVVVNQYYRTGTNSPVDILIQASDIDSQTLTFTVSSPISGTLTGHGPALVYMPDLNFEGDDFIIGTAHDGSDESLPATITLYVGATDVITKEDTPVSIKEQLAVFGNPADMTITKAPEHGYLDGIIPALFYIPDPNFYGDNIMMTCILKFYHGQALAALANSEYSGNGTSEKPFVYSWQTQMATDWQADTPRPEIKQMN
jgi:hypothetical protein